MDQLSQEITGNEGRTKGSTNYVNADTQVKQVYESMLLLITNNLLSIF